MYLVHAVSTTMIGDENATTVITMTMVVRVIALLANLANKTKSITGRENRSNEKANGTAVHTAKVKLARLVCLDKVEALKPALSVLTLIALEANTPKPVPPVKVPASETVKIPLLVVLDAVNSDKLQKEIL